MPLGGGRRPTSLDASGRDGRMEEVMTTHKFVTVFARKKAERLTLLAQVVPLGQRRGEAYFKVMNDQYEMFGWFRTLHSGKEVFRVNVHDIRNLCEVKS